MAKTAEFPEVHFFDVYLFGEFQSNMGEFADTEEEAKAILLRNLSMGVGHPEYWQLHYTGKGKEHARAKRRNR